MIWILAALVIWLTFPTIGLTWLATHREDQRGSQLNSIRATHGLGIWGTTALVSIGWPYVLWRLHKGFSEDAAHQPERPGLLRNSIESGTSRPSQNGPHNRSSPPVE